MQLQSKTGGTFIVPCIVNGLKMKFIFDTGASNVSISATEALYMLKHGQLYVDDLGEAEYYRIADGSIKEGTSINLKEIKFGLWTLNNVIASVSHELNAPLLLGQSALSRLGKIQIDYKNSTLTVVE